MVSFLRTIEQYRGIAMGFLLVLTASILFEQTTSVLYFSISVVVCVVALFLAKRTAHHFHAEHVHEGDSMLDMTGGIVLLLANILHPALDGFSVTQSVIQEGALAGIIVGGSVVLHELFRQSALSTLLAPLRIKWQWVVATALLGIGFGVVLGIAGTSILEQYEHIIDFATVFAYSFIIGEFYFAQEENHKKQNTKLIAIGVCIGILVTIFLH